MMRYKNMFPLKWSQWYASICIMFCMISPQVQGAENSNDTIPTLSLSDVLRSVTALYPPYLASLIERDIAQGKLRSTRGTFDFQTFAKIFRNPTGFYQSSTAEAGFEQFTTLWGSTIFGGYRWTEGFLPDYYHERRTDGGGTPFLGMKIPILRNGSIDQRRAAIRKSELDVLLADPIIKRQHLDFSRAAALAYLTWVLAGKNLDVADRMLQLAKDRESVIVSRIQQGLTAKVVSLENRQIVASRSMDAVKARRGFEAASISLSLFIRDASDETLQPKRHQLPEAWPTEGNQPDNILNLAWNHAMQHRPELKVYEIELQKLGIDRDFYRNQWLPSLDAVVSGSQSLGTERYEDTGEFELKLGVEFRMPLQRNTTKGNIQANAANIEQVEQKAAFAADKIWAEIDNALSALTAAGEQIELALENRTMAQSLREIEADRFRLGATNLLSLQLREQIAFKAEQTWIKANHDYYRAITDLLIISGIDFRTYQHSNTELWSLASQWNIAKSTLSSKPAKEIPISTIVDENVEIDP